MGPRTTIVFFLSTAILLGCANRDPIQTAKEGSVGELDAKIKQYVAAKAPLKIGTKTNVRFGDNFILLGYDISDTHFRPGETVKITWYWRCIRPVAAGWQLFTHGIEGENNIVLNSDHKGIEQFASVRKKFPPSKWRPNTYIRDIERLKIPEDFASEQLELRVGVWLGNDRVPVKKGRSDGENRARGPVLRKRPPKKIEVALKRLSTSPELDGEISAGEPWKDALKLSGFKELIKGKQSKKQTELYLGYTDEFLFIAASMEDDYLSIPEKARDDMLWRGDALTLLLDPGGDEKNYHEIQSNPAGAFYHAVLSRYRQVSSTFDGRAKWAVKIDGTLEDDTEKDRGWQVEIRIPLEVFGNEAPKPGDIWHANFFRTDVRPESTEYSAWSPTLRGDLHYFKKFGKLTIGK